MIWCMISIGIVTERLIVFNVFVTEVLMAFTLSSWELIQRSFILIPFLRLKII